MLSGTLGSGSGFPALGSVILDQSFGLSIDFVFSESKISSHLTGFLRLSRKAVYKMYYFIKRPVLLKRGRPHKFCSLQ